MPFFAIEVPLGIESPGQAGDFNKIIGIAENAINTGTSRRLSYGKQPGPPSERVKIDLDVTPERVVVQTVPYSGEHAGLHFRLDPGGNNSRDVTDLYTVPATEGAMKPLIYPTRRGIYDMYVIFYSLSRRERFIQDMHTALTVITGGLFKSK